MTFYLQLLCVIECLKHSNDTTKLNMLKYTNCSMIKIYINRLSTTRQIFIAMDYSIMMSEKYFHFRKKKDFGKDILSPPLCRSNLIYELWKYFSNYVFFRFLKDIYKNLKEIGIIKAVSKLAVFENLRISKFLEVFFTVFRVRNLFLKRNILTSFIFFEESWKNLRFCNLTYNIYVI